LLALPARAIVRFRWLVIAAWIAVALLLAPRAARLPDLLTVRGSYTRSDESSRAAQVIKQAFPRPIADYVAIVVRGPVRYTHPRYATLLDSLSATASRRPYVSQVISLRRLGDSAFASRDRRTTFLIVALAPESNDDVSRNLVPDLRSSLRATQAQMPDVADFEVRVTGNQALDYDTRMASAADTRRGEQRALPLTLLVLVLAFGAIVAAMLPITVGLLAITIALGLVAAAASFTTISVFVLNITTMVGLGVGIDYSLLVVTRFREELNRGLSPRDAAIRTIHTAGAAVVTSGVTVVVGFAALLTTPLSETRSVGIGGLVVVSTAVLLAVTFLPAALTILGRDIDRPRWLARVLAPIHAPTGWERWARWLAHRRGRALAIGGAVVGLFTLPLITIRIGLPAANWFPPGSESSGALAELRRIGAGGVIHPTRVIVQLPEGESAVAARRLGGLKALSDSLHRDPRVREVRGVTSIQPGLSTLQLAIFYGDAGSARDRYPEFLNAYLSADRRTTLIDVIPADTVSLTGMMGLVRDIRARVAQGLRGLTGAEVLVGGFAATGVDLQHDLLTRFPGVVALVLGVTAIMLFVAFRSLLVPIKAVILNCCSVMAAFGVTVLVFQHGYGGALFGLEGPTEAIFVVVPVLVFATVFGLSMDYEVFLLARVKEVFDKTGRNDHATMEGLSATASTITFAASIMVIVFGVFAFSQVLAVQFIGFGLAVAVLLDATVIRMVLVPAIMHIAGRWNWWPGVRAPRREPEAP
jgi:RND superfamily putative drug exporter